ncbi:MAG: LLM class F420-dependent oxidoreductase [Actinomycetota bacterium]|nr:MAG: LLM class F420-dependent oxidoreductase [Actinomycetota bacterium]
MLGRIGIWSAVLDRVEVSQTRDLVAELDETGWHALWFGESTGRESMANSAMLLGASQRLVIGTGIASIYARDPMAANGGSRLLAAQYPGRFVLGLGVSHRPLVEGGRHQTYGPPLQAMSAYLDAMDAVSSRSVEAAGPRAPRVLAALGPRMLELARDRADGALPYLVTPDHTAGARQILGPDKTLAVEQSVVLTADRQVALARGRDHLAQYLPLPNYVRSWRRQGFTEDDLSGGGSDRLVNALVAWGEPDQIAAAVAEHLAAGADHVCVQVVPTDDAPIPVAQWRALAPALLG